MSYGVSIIKVGIIIISLEVPRLSRGQRRYHSLEGI